MRGAEHTSRLSSVLTVLMAVAALVIAWGNDSDTMARAALGHATGPLVADSLNGGAVLTADAMAPGDTRAAEITVSNAGDEAGAMSLGISNVSDVSARGGLLSQVLDLEVIDVTPGRPSTVVYAGRLADLGAAPLGTYEQGDAHRYRFVVSFPRGSADAVDNTFQGASARADFVWTATQTSPGNGNGNGNGSGGGNGGGTASPGDVPVQSVDPGVIEDHVEQSKAPGALKLRIYVRRVQAAHRKRVYVNVFCSRACKIAATGVVSLPSKHKKWKLRALKGTVKRQGTMKFKMSLPAKALGPLNTALLHRKHASVTLKITSAAGKQTLRWTRTIRLAR